MSTALGHICLDCGKQVLDGQRGLMHHYDGANPVKVEDCCDAMTARACNHAIKELLDQKKLDSKDRDRLSNARRTRASVRGMAARQGRTLNESGSPFHVE